MEAARRSKTLSCIEGRYRRGSMALNTVYSSGVRSVAPLMSQRSFPSGLISPRRKRIMGCSISAISDSVSTPGRWTYPSRSNVAICSSVTTYASPECEGDAAAARSARARTDAARRRPAPTNAKEGRAVARTAQEVTVAMRK